jgi:TRAP-type C4-dicarboxylate transport system permease small subunit
MNTLLGVERTIVRIETALLVLSLSVMILVSFAQVVLRNLFDTGILWGDPVVRHLMLWSGFIGAAIASSVDRHIAIDFLSKYLSPRLRGIARVVTLLFAIVVCAVLADAAMTLLLEEKAAGSTIVLDIPSWVGMLVIPPGYYLMAFHFLIKIIQIVAGKTEKSPSHAS